MPLSVNDYRYFNSGFEGLGKALGSIRKDLNQIKRTIRMNFADLDAAIAVEAADLADLQKGLKDNSDVIDALTKKVAAGQDVSAEVTALQKNNRAFSDAIASLAATDNPQPTPTPAPAPTPTPPTPPGPEIPNGIIPGPITNT